MVDGARSKLSSVFCAFRSFCSSSREKAEVYSSLFLFLSSLESCCHSRHVAASLSALFVVAAAAAVGFTAQVAKERSKRRTKRRRGGERGVVEPPPLRSETTKAFRHDVELL